MVYICLAEGFEEIEALTIIDILRRGSVEAKSLSISGSRLVKGTHGINVEADLIFEDGDFQLCEMIVLPGGMPGALNLQNHKGLAKEIKSFANEGKLLAAICAAPMGFGAHGILKGKRATIYPGMEKSLKGASATGENVTTDGNIITGMGPACAMEFALKLLEILKGSRASAEIAQELLFDRR